MAESLTQAAVLRALRGIQDPDLHRDIVSLGFVRLRHGLTKRRKGR